MPASTLWSKLQEMPRPHRLIDFPRTGPDGKPVGQVAMFVLTQEEQMICAAAAEKFAKEKLKDPKKDEIGYETLYSNASVVEILFRACKDADDTTRPAFPSPGAIRVQLTADECSALFEHYLSTQLEFGPIITQLSKEEYDAWIERIAQGGLAANPFPLLSSEMQKVLAYIMACLIVSFRNSASSAGSQPESTSTAEAVSE